MLSLTDFSMFPAHFRNKNLVKRVTIYIWQLHPWHRPLNLGLQLHLLVKISVFRRWPLLVKPQFWVWSGQLQDMIKAFTKYTISTGAIFVICNKGNFNKTFWIWLSRCIVFSSGYMKKCIYLFIFSRWVVVLGNFHFPMKPSSSHYPLCAEVNTQTHTDLILIWRAISKMSFSIHALVMCKRPVSPKWSH